MLPIAPGMLPVATLTYAHIHRPGRHRHTDRHDMTSSRRRPFPFRVVCYQLPQVAPPMATHLHIQTRKTQTHTDMVWSAVGDVLSSPLCCCLSTTCPKLHPRTPGHSPCGRYTHIHIHTYRREDRQTSKDEMVVYVKIERVKRVVYDRRVKRVCQA